EVRLAHALASLAQRQHPLELSTPNAEHTQIRYRVPAGYRFSQIPQSRQIDTAYGKFRLDVHENEYGAEVRSALEFEAHRIETDRYEAFRAWLGEIDTALKQTFELVRDR